LRERKDMADFEISIPAPDDNIEMTVGQSLQITFVDARRFCSPIDASTYFSPALPNGKQDRGYVWTGVAQAAGIGQTVKHHSVGHDVDCESKIKRSGNRSIQISGSIPP
jgi:hypothetical protein